MQSRYYIKRFTLLHKIIFFLLFFMLVGIFSLHFNVFGFKNLLYQKYPNLELRLHLFDKESVMENFENDFNVKFLPATQFINLNIEKVKLNFTQSFNTNHSKKLKENSSLFKSFYLELLEDKTLPQGFKQKDNSEEIIECANKLKNIKPVINIMK